MADLAARSARCVALQLALACDLSEVRPATLAVRGFLAEQGLSEDELAACELALAEACNNTISYAPDEDHAKPIEVEVICSAATVEIRVNDRTPGFDWPEHIDLPPLESERGRGLFLIRSLMDSTDYFQGSSENSLRMCKRRARDAARALPAAVSVEELNRKVAVNEQIIRDMAEELSSCYESLSAIFRYSTEQGGTISLEEFARRLMNDLLRITLADWFLLRLAPDAKTRLDIFTASESATWTNSLTIPPTGETDDSAEVRSVVMQQDIWFDHQKPLDEGDPLARAKPDSLGLIHPLYFGDTLIGTLTLGRTVSRVPFTAAQTNVVHTFADFLAIQIVNARFQEERVNTLLMGRELQIATNIQRSLLRKTLPQLPGFGLAGYCESARQVGGDFYDVVKLSDHSILLIIADVMGKGIPAAMFAAILRSLLRALPELTDQPSELLARANRLLFEELSEVDMFITAQLAFIDSRERRLVTASAGHCPLLLASGTPPKVSALSPDGLPLGILPDTTFTDATAPLTENCRLLMYTDGLTEAVNPRGELFGQERLVDWLAQTTQNGATAEDLKLELAHDLRRFQLNTSLKDDQTFLILAR